MEQKELDPRLHFVVTTAVIVKGGPLDDARDKKFLIVKRSSHEKAFPNKWSVPGGKFVLTEYQHLPKEAEHPQWYNVAEFVIRKEVREEVNVEIEKPIFLHDLVFVRPDGYPVVTLVHWAQYASGEVVLDSSHSEYAWVTLEEAKSYDLIEGVWDELKAVADILTKANYARKKLFKVIITAIVVKDGKHFDDAEGRYLVLQRAAHEKKFPLRWTVPGGKISTDDYTNLPKDTPDYWYNVLERTLKREVEQEAGIQIQNIRYVTSLADVRADDAPSLVVSCLADFAGGDVVIEKDMQDHRWVTRAEAKHIDLIEGIYEELEIAEKMLKGEQRREWGRG